MTFLPTLVGERELAKLDELFVQSVMLSHERLFPEVELLLFDQDDDLAIIKDLNYLVREGFWRDEIY